MILEMAQTLGTSLSDEQCSFEWRKTYSYLIISSAKEGSRHTPVQTDEETEKHNFWYLDTQRDATPYQKHQAPFIMDGGTHHFGGGSPKRTESSLYYAGKCIIKGLRYT